MNEFKKEVKKVKWDSILISLLTIAIGVLCLVFPNTTGDILVYIIASIIMFVGMILFVRSFFMLGFFGAYSVIIGISFILLGMFSIISPEYVKGLTVVFLGLYIVIDSATSIVESVQYSRMGIKNWWIIFASALISMILGIILMFSDFSYVMIYAGIVMLVEGLRKLVLTLTIDRKVKRLKKKYTINDDDVIDVDVIDEK